MFKMALHCNGVIILLGVKTIRHLMAMAIIGISRWQTSKFLEIASRMV